MEHTDNSRTRVTNIYLRAINLIVTLIYLHLYYIDFELFRGQSATSAETLCLETSVQPQTSLSRVNRLGKNVIVLGKNTIKLSNRDGTGVDLLSEGSCGEQECLIAEVC